MGLMAAAGVEGFYEQYGFVRRPENRPGMFMTANAILALRSRGR